MSDPQVPVRDPHRSGNAGEIGRSIDRNWSGLLVPLSRILIVAGWLGPTPGRARVLAAGCRLGDLDDPPQVRCLRQKPLHVGSGARSRIGAWVIHQLSSLFERIATDVLHRKSTRPDTRVAK